MLVFQLLSFDQRVQADCTAQDRAADAFEHAAIFTGRSLTAADAAMIRASNCEVHHGRFVRYARSVYAVGPRVPVAEGDCKIYAFPTAGDQNAFCLLSGAIPARFVRAIASDNLA